MLPSSKTISYCGCSETSFRARYNNHKQSIKMSSKRHQTKLSKFVRRFNDVSHIPVIKWFNACQTIQQRRNALPTVLGKKTGNLAGRLSHELEQNILARGQVQAPEQVN